MTNWMDVVFFFIFSMSDDLLGFGMFCLDGFFSCQKFFRSHPWSSIFWGASVSEDWDDSWDDS